MSRGRRGLSAGGVPLGIVRYPAGRRGYVTRSPEPFRVPPLLDEPNFIWLGVEIASAALVFLIAVAGGAVWGTLLAHWLFGW